MIVNLAKFQNEGVESAMDLFSTHHRHMQVLATGGGKTVLSGDLIKKLVEQGKKVWFFVDTTELQVQSRSSFIKMFGLQVDSLTAQSQRVPTAKVVVGMIQTLKSRIKKPAKNPYEDPESTTKQKRSFNEQNRTRDKWLRALETVDYVIIDEAHVQQANDVMGKIDESGAFDNARICGLTATPTTLGKVKLCEYYESYNEIANTKELIEWGYLVPMIHRVDATELTGLKKSGGDYSASSVNEAFKKAGKVTNFVKLINETNEKYGQYFGRNVLKTILYANGKEYIQELNQRLLNDGKASNIIISDAKTQSKAERAEAIALFKRNVLDFLVNIMVLTKGFDDKEIAMTVQMFATLSLSKYLQVLGRASRPLVEGLHLMQSAEQRREAIARSAKPFAITLDLGGNVKKHGKYADVRDWNPHFYGIKKDSDNSYDAPVKQCPKCNNYIHASLVRCNEEMPYYMGGQVLMKVCGHVFETKSREDREIKLQDLDSIDSFMVTEVVKPLKDMTAEELKEYKTKGRKGDMWLVIQLAKRNDIKHIKEMVISKYSKGKKIDYIQELLFKKCISEAQGIELMRLILQGMAKNKAKKYQGGNYNFAIKNEYNRIKIAVESASKGRDRKPEHYFTAYRVMNYDK